MAESGVVWSLERQIHGFIRGFEAGTYWQRMCEGQPRIVGLIHDTNTEMIIRMCEAMGYRFTGGESGPGWMTVELERTDAWSPV